MRKTVDVQIGDSSYQITTFPAGKGVAILQKLLKIVGPAFAELVGDAFSEGASVNVQDLASIAISEDAFSVAVTRFIESLDTVDASKLLSSMCEGVLKDQRELKFDQDFAGDYGSMVRLIGAIIKENYSSFFDENGFGALASLVPNQPL